LTIPATISINHNVAFGLEEQELYSSLRLKFAPRNNNVETTLKIKRLNKYHIEVIDTATYPCELSAVVFTSPIRSFHAMVIYLPFYFLLFFFS
jgi:hypothetical protein